MQAEIKFGTDGWRGVIARDFTFNNVKLVTQSICDYLRKLPTTDRGPGTVIVGYDCRFLSREYARACGAVLSGNGFKALLADEAAPTPAVSYNVVSRKCLGAIIITASHNPYDFNGLKFKTSLGASAGAAVTRAFEELCGRNLPVENDRQISAISLKNNYLSHLAKLVDLAAVKRSRTRIVIDPMFGAGQGYLEELLAGGKAKLASLNNKVDPLFGGINPEPIAANLAALVREVKRTRSDIGIALDGDGDRIGLVDRQGTFVNSHQIFSLLLLHLVRNRKQRGIVVKTLSGTYLLERICAKFGLPWRETPIGFKYIGDLMLKEDVLIGGEESGGIGFRNHIPERDGILSALYMLEMMAVTGQSLSALRSSLFREFGISCYDRVDLKLAREAIDKQKFSTEMVVLAKAGILNDGLRKIIDYDGVKLVMKDSSWLLLRPSGTEPVVRVYAEADSQAKVNKLIDTGRKLVYKFNS